MRCTRKTDITENTILVSTDRLREALMCGRESAVKLATDAGARVEVGRRVLWNLEKVKKYVEEISE